MRRTIALLAAGLVGAATIAAGPAQQQRPADPETTLELEIGDADAATGVSAGVNPWNFTEDTYRCDDSPEAACKVVLIKVTNPYDEANAKKGRERANLDLALSSTTPAGDFALNVWESDESGARGEYIGYSDVDPGPDYEQMTVIVTSTEDAQEFWYRVEVIYWAMAGDFTLDASFNQ